MKKLILSLVIVVSALSVQAQSNNPFPTTDSLAKFTNKWIRNSPIDAFDKLRMNTAMIGIIRFIQGTYGGQVKNFYQTGDTLRIVTLEDTLDVVLTGGAGGTNLTFTRNATTVTIISSSGADAILPSATQSNAGILTAADKLRIDSSLQLQQFRDSLAMFLRAVDTIGMRTDTTSLSNRIDLRQPAGNYLTGLNGSVLATGPVGGGVGNAVLANTTVTPGDYVNPNLTIGPDGRITAAANGTSGGSGTDNTNLGSFYKALNTTSQGIKTFEPTTTLLWDSTTNTLRARVDTSAGKIATQYMVSLKADPLGFTPENVANKATSTSLGSSNTLYPTQNAVKTYVDNGLSLKQDLIGYTPENIANKSTNTALGSSNTLYPTQNAVKTYVDNGLATKQDIISLTTTGTSGAATFLGGVLNIPNYSVTGGGTVNSFAFTDGNGFDGTVINATSNPSLSLSFQNAAADGATKGQAGFTAADFNAAAGIIGLDYVNGQKASTSLSGFLSATDWQTFNAKQGAISLTTTGSSGAATFVGGVINIPQYAGTTYTFDANDFNGTTSISLDYTNGQSASASSKGYLTAADWTTFNAKQSSLSNLGSSFRWFNGTAGFKTVRGINGVLIDSATSNTLTLQVDSSVYATQSDLAAAVIGGGGVTSVAGTTNRITSSGGTTPSIDIASTYVGQPSITTLGTIGTGVWNATKIGMTYGGVPTGGNTGQLLAKVDGTDNNLQWIDNAGSNNGLTGLGIRPLYQGTQNLRTLIASTGMLIDTTTNINNITYRVDTATIFTSLTTALNARQPTITLTTTGSGAASFIGNVLNIPTPSGGSTDTLVRADAGLSGMRMGFARNDSLFFKRINVTGGGTITQEADSSVTINISGGGGSGTLDGSGTSGYLSKWSAGTTLGNSGIYQTSSGYGIGTTTPGAPLHIYSSFNSGVSARIENPNTGASANAGFALISDGGTFNVYRTSIAYGFGVNDATVLQDPDKLIFYTGANKSLETGSGGSVRISDAYTLPTTIGTSGQVLRVPASGSVLEWGSGGGGGSQTLQETLDLGNTSSTGMFLTGDNVDGAQLRINGFAVQGYSGTSVILGNNTYYNTTAGSRKVINAGTGSFIQMSGDQLYFSSTSSGSADGNVTPTLIATMASAGINFHGAYTFPTTAGSANQVLAMPASGTQLVWATGGGGGSQNLQQTLDNGSTSTTGFSLTGNKTNGAHALFNSLAIQGYSNTNTIIGGNAYYNTTAGSYRTITSGLGAIISLNGESISLMSTTNGGADGNATVTDIATFDKDGSSINTLAGTGTRMVVASSTGLLSTQAIPSGGGSQTLQQTLDFGNTSTTGFFLSGNQLNGAHARFNGLAIQGYAADNTILGNNVYYNTGASSYRTITSALGSIISMNGETITLISTTNGGADGNATPTTIASFDKDGIAFHGAYTFPTTDGTNGYQLTTNGSGVLTWQAAGSGGGGSAAWGSITGTLSSQSDLNTALGLKAPISNPTFTTAITTPRIIASGSAPSAVDGPNLNATVTVDGTDIAGRITVVVISATSTPTLEEYATVTFATPYASQPRIVFSPGNAAAAGLEVYLKNPTTNNFSIAKVSSGTSSVTTYIWDYMVVQ